MKTRPRSFDRMVEAIARFPSIGPKSASRIALWLLNRPADVAEDIADAITTGRKLIARCKECNQLSEEDICPVCRGEDRDRSILCVVEETPDAWQIESTGQYRGLYHVLGGVLSPLDGVSVEDLRIGELTERIRRSSGAVAEVILATDFDTEGNATASYIAECIAETGVKITRLAYGLPAGAELAYSNETTLAHALSGRRSVS